MNAWAAACRRQSNNPAARVSPVSSALRRQAPPSPPPGRRLARRPSRHRRRRSRFRLPRPPGHPVGGQHRTERRLARGLPVGSLPVCVYVHSGPPAIPGRAAAAWHSAAAASDRGQRSRRPDRSRGRRSGTGPAGRLTQAPGVAGRLRACGHRHVLHLRIGGPPVPPARPARRKLVTLY